MREVLAENGVRGLALMAGRGPKRNALITPQAPSLSRKQRESSGLLWKRLSLVQSTELGG